MEEYLPCGDLDSYVPLLFPSFPNPQADSLRVAIAFFLLLWLLWFWIFRAIFRRRRQNNVQTLPTTSTSYPATSGYPDTTYANTGASYTASSGYGNGNNTGGAAAGYYNSEPQMSEAYTKPPQAAYHPSGQDSYAPPAGAPPGGYASGYEGGGYAPPSGAPPYGR
jgi:hypothetical protein